MPIMWCLANPKVGERAVLAALLDHNHHLIRDSQVLLADNGFSGKQFKQITDAMGYDYYDRTARTRPTATATSAASASGSSQSRQTLKGQLSLEQHGGRTPHGVFTRVTQRLLAMATYLAQPDHRCDQQTIADRLRSLTPT
jgi:hypothetical protein